MCTEHRRSWELREAGLLDWERNVNISKKELTEKEELSPILAMLARPVWCWWLAMRVRREGEPDRKAPGETINKTVNTQSETKYKSLQRKRK